MSLSSPLRRRTMLRSALVLTAALATLGSTAQAQGPRHFASLQRWMDQSPRGKAVAKQLASLKALNAHSVEIVLNQPYAPLLAQLALPSGMAVIMAKDSIATPLTSFIGTGPYRFKERKPDQYVLLTRFDKYRPRKEAAS